MAEHAAVDGEKIEGRDSLEIALKRIRLPGTNGRCYTKREDGDVALSTTTEQGKKIVLFHRDPLGDVIRFECSVGDRGEIGYTYLARVTKEGDRFVVLSLVLLGTRKY